MVWYKFLIYIDTFYPVELILVYYKYNKPFEGLVHLTDWKEIWYGIIVICWDNIEDNNEYG